MNPQENKEFDENFPLVETTVGEHVGIDVIGGKDYAPLSAKNAREQIKSFISSLLTRRDEELRKKIADYIQKERHKVERTDRYIINGILDLLPPHSDKE